MTTFLGLARTSEKPTTEDEAALVGALRELGMPQEAIAVRRGERWVSAGAADDPRLDLDRGVLRPPDGMDPTYTVRSETLTLVGNSVRALLATGLAKRALDPVGLSGLLWRGAPMDARLPVAGVTSLKPGNRFIAGRPIEVEPHTGLPSWPSFSCVAPSRDGQGAAAEVAAAHTEFATVEDMPSSDGFLGFLAARAIRAADPAGPGGPAEHAPPCDAALLDAIAEPAKEPWRLRRPGPGGDPLDLDAQRALELDALAEEPLHRAQSLLALFPAAARRALASLPERPPDGVVPEFDSGREMAVELVRLGALVDGPMRDAALAFEVTGVRAALPVRGGDAPDPALDAALRGPLASWLDAALARDRLAGQRIWNEDAVGEGVSRWRAKRAGWTARHVFLLARVARWIERERLAIEVR